MRFICRNGGTLQVDGTTDTYDMHVWNVTLESGRLYFAGTHASYGAAGDGGPFGLRIDDPNVSVYSTGDSILDLEDGNPNHLSYGKGAPVTFKVDDGTLTVRMTVSGDLNKTGAGAIRFDGASGGSMRGVINIKEGTLIASEQLVNYNLNKVITLEGGTSLDISGLTGTFDFAAFQEAGGRLESNGRVTVITGDRIIRNGDRLISWKTAPGCTFVPADAESPVGLVKKSDGLYAVVGMSITIR